ncbi:MAG: dienelactone hydrolase family protein [Alphaproteobacteria bacterium]|nr:dienelactone hydrolase family protein [Alphaproteobacteria bacterium]
MRAAASTAVLILAAFARTAGAVGFQQATAPDPGDKPLAVAIWYPSKAPAAPHAFGLLTFEVAENGPVAGSRLPLVVISHGTGGSNTGHVDTAMALAEAGFVVAAVNHTGDNDLDQSHALTRQNFIDRPRHLSRVIDYMLTAWPAHKSIDPGRVGAFGHSLGGFTVLIAAGGVADFARARRFCSDHADAWICRQGRYVQSINASVGATDIGPARDRRIKAGVAAAPAEVYEFPPGGLAGVTIPVQVWAAGQDTITPPKWDADLLRTALPAVEFHNVPGAGHLAFLAPCNDALARAVPDICYDPPGFDRASFHRDFDRAVVTFFRTQLPRRH